MHFKQCSLVGGLKRVIVFVLLITTFLVCGEKEEPSDVGLRYQLPSMPEKQQQRQKQNKQQQHQRTSHPFGVYFSQKRKVPNASDPLHNRWGHGLIFLCIFNRVCDQGWQMSSKFELRFEVDLLCRGTVKFFDMHFVNHDWRLLERGGGCCFLLKIFSFIS